MEHPKKKLSAIEKVKAKYGQSKKTVGTYAVGFGAGYAASKGKQILDAGSKISQKVSEKIAMSKLRKKISNEVGKATSEGKKMYGVLEREKSTAKELYKRSMGTPTIKEPIPMRKPETKIESKSNSTTKAGKKISFKDAAKAASKVGAKNAVKRGLTSAAKKLPYIGAGIAIGEVGKDVYDYYKGKKAKNAKDAKGAKKETTKKDLRDKPAFESEK
jgi:hypothetical protein